MSILDLIRNVRFFAFVGLMALTGQLHADDGRERLQIDAIAGLAASAKAPTYAIASTPPATAMVAETCNVGACSQCVNRGQGLIGGYGIKHEIHPVKYPNTKRHQRPPFLNSGFESCEGSNLTNAASKYCLRMGDEIQLLFIINGVEAAGPCRCALGDEWMIESEVEHDLTRIDGKGGMASLLQPEGRTSLRLLGQAQTADRTLEPLQDVIEAGYEKLDENRALKVHPLSPKLATRRIWEPIDSGGALETREISQTVTTTGEIRLPRIGGVRACGLTVEELKQEISLRYDQIVDDLEVEISLKSRSPDNVLVLGEVVNPGRYEVGNTPTTLLEAIELSGGHRTGANLRQVVIFRRGENWQLLSTLLDLRAANLERDANRADDIWLRDGDVIVLPSASIRVFSHFVRQVFTEGVYGVVPIAGYYDLAGSRF